MLDIVSLIKEISRRFQSCRTLLYEQYFPAKVPGLQ